MGRRVTAATVLGSFVLTTYLAAYIMLSAAGRYEPIAFGSNGVKCHSWAPRGFYADLRWQKVPLVFFLPLYWTDRWLWHTDGKAHSGRYPITEADREDIWKYYKAEGLFEESNVNGSSFPASRHSSGTSEHGNQTHPNVSVTTEEVAQGVTGMVTIDGRPLENATVELIPVAGGETAGCQTSANGRFELEEGVVPGEYKVRIVPKASPTTGEGTKTKGDTGGNAGIDTSEEKSGR